MTADQERAAIVRFMREAIDQGYPGAPGNTRCNHDRYAWEECIGCYDEYLNEALAAIERGDHHKDQGHG